MINEPRSAVICAVVPMMSPPNTATATLDATRCMMLFIALPDVVSCLDSAETPLVMIGIIASPTPTLRTVSHSSM